MCFLGILDEERFVDDDIWFLSFDSGIDLDIFGCKLEFFFLLWKLEYWGVLSEGILCCF